jgi:hypothetical protein
VLHGEFSIYHGDIETQRIPGGEILEMKDCSGGATGVPPVEAGEDARLSTPAILPLR